jgi:hypothetical protein
MPIMNGNFFVRAGGQIRGPFSWDQLLDLCKRSRLQPFHEISSDRHKWTPASSVDGLFQSMRITETPSASQANSSDSGGKPAQAMWQPVEQGPFDSTRPRSQGFNLAWKAARTGITLAAIGACVFAGSIAAFFLALLVALLNVGPRVGSVVGSLTAIALVLVITRVLILSAQILETIGFGFCAASPTSSGSRGLGVATFTTALASLIVDFIYMITWLASGPAFDISEKGEWAQNNGGALASLLVISGFSFITYRFLFLLHLRATALAFNAGTLAKQLVYLIVLYGVLLVLPLVGLSIIVFSVHTDSARAMLAVGIQIFLVVSVAWLVWYIVLLFRCRATIRAI